MDPFTSALDLAKAIKSRELSPVEVVDTYLAQIDKLNPILNAIIWRRDEELRREAKAAEAAVMRGEPLAPFHGVPIPIKDLTAVKGWPTTHGSKAALGMISQYDASVVTQLRQAGFLLMGRTNTPEFGSLPVTENEAYGVTRNPWNPQHTPGGSSGGAAAAVAAGMAPVAHASDGGGSIRIPASCCGLVGLKPSRGRIPRGPFLSDVLHGFATDGSVTRTVGDTAALLDVLSYYDPYAWYNAPQHTGRYLDEMQHHPPPLRIAYMLKGIAGFQPDKSCSEAVKKTAQLLQRLGHEVFEGGPDLESDAEQLMRDFFSVWYTGTAYVDLDWSKVEELNRGLRRKGEQQNSIVYQQTLVRLQMFSRRVVTAWNRDFDVLLTPSIAMEPPKVGWLFETGETDAEKILWRSTSMVPYSGWCNVTGLPAISLPTYRSIDTGLPVGVQLVGAPFREDTLIRLAAQLESELEWPKETPQLSIA